MTTPRIEETIESEFSEKFANKTVSGTDHHEMLMFIRQALTQAHQAGKKEGIDEAVEKQKKEELTEIEIQNIVVETIGSQYQKRFNEYLDYDQWQGIREEMRICGTMIFKRMKEDLELNRQALDDTIKALQEKK